MNLQLTDAQRCALHDFRPSLLCNGVSIHRPVSTLRALWRLGLLSRYTESDTRPDKYTIFQITDKGLEAQKLYPYQPETDKPLKQ